MDILGWSTASMAKRYQHVVPELLQIAAERMTAALWGQLQPQLQPNGLEWDKTCEDFTFSPELGEWAPAGGLLTG